MLMFILKLFVILLLLFIAYILFTFICTLFIDVNKSYKTENRFYRFLLDSWTWIGIKLCRIKIKTTIHDELPENTRVVVVGNHRSNYDPIITWYILKNYQLAYISKPSNFKIPLFGKIVRRCCFMKIDRLSPRNSLKTIEEAIELINNDVASIGVYPEGTRSKTGELLPFHNCVFKIAQRSESPLVVVTLNGTENIHKNTPFRKTVIEANINVIKYEDIKDLQTCDIGESVRKIISYNLNEEVSQNQNTLCES